MLRAYYEAATGGPMVCWDGVDHGPILRFRTLVHGLSRPPRWREYDAGEGPWIDLARRLAGPHAERPALDQIARRLGLPGLLGYADVDLVDAWLEGRRAEVDGYCELAALNVLLLALRWFGVTGELAQGATGAAVDRLRDLFWDASEPHRIAFRDALGHA